MKTGKTLTELAREIERQQHSKRDFLAPTTAMEMRTVDDKRVQLHVGNGGGVDVGLNDIAHGQLGEHVKIPAAYYKRMREEAPDLLATNVNRWFAKYPAKRMVRTMDGTARAFLSDGYRPLEHADLAEAVLPILLEQRLEIMSCEITERRLYIKAVDERIKKDVPSGRKIGDGSHVFFDTCSPAIIISNSEVGLGMLSVETGIFTKVCTNLATIAGAGMKRRHLGARHELTDGEALRELLSDDTKRATDKAIWMQISDVVRGAFDEMRFEAATNKLAGLAAQKIEGDPVKMIDLAAKRWTLNDHERNSVLKHLIEGGDLSRYGLFNAVTRTAQDLEDYDRATDFERMGGKVVELPRHEWQELAMAA
jgi:hypothetical protein